MRQLEMEEEALEKELAEGRITVKEFNKEMRELHKDYYADAQAEAEQAYEDRMNDFYY